MVYLYFRFLQLILDRLFVYCAFVQNTYLFIDSFIQGFGNASALQKHSAQCKSSCV